MTGDCVQAELVLGQLKLTVRRIYSSPAIHAAGIMALVLGDAQLRAQWEGEVTQMRERIRGMRLEDGSRLEVVPLPMPAPLTFDRTRLPASYANFYIANGVVLVPTFNDPNDRVALGILGELFKDRPVVGIHAVDLVLGYGTLHCLTQQEPL